MNTPDFVFSNHGSLWLVHPTSLEAREHLLSHVQPNNSTWHGRDLAVEPRYVEALAANLEQDGFRVEV